MDIARIVREYLSEHGIKQTFLAEKCGWSKQKTNSIILGRKKMAADEMASICNAVGVPYSYFYEIAYGEDCNSDSA